jgi:hypothetical protein
MVVLLVELNVFSMIFDVARDVTILGKLRSDFVGRLRTAVLCEGKISLDRNIRSVMVVETPAFSDESCLMISFASLANANLVVVVSSFSSSV